MLNGIPLFVARKRKVEGMDANDMRLERALRLGAVSALGTRKGSSVGVNKLVFLKTSLGQERSVAPLVGTQVRAMVFVNT